MKPKPKVDVVYLEEDLKTVINYFVKGFQKDKAEVRLMDSFVDPAKCKVVLKLMVKDSEFDSP